MKRHLGYISSAFMTGLLILAFNVPAISQAKSGEHEGHAGHDEAGEGHEEGVIELDQEAQAMIQLKTEPAEMRVVERRLKVFGKIAKDTEGHSYVTAGDGIIEKIHVDLGTAVEKGSPLLTVRKSDGTFQDAPADIPGVILAVYVKPGDHVDRLKSLMSIVNIDTLRATVDVYEKDIGFVEVGQKAQMESIAFPGKKFDGEVVYVSPQVEEDSQAVKVRVDVDNSQHLLRLGMFVSAELIQGSDKKVLAVPQSAVQELNGEDIVFVMEDKNRFVLREVILGQSLGDDVEIKKGIGEKERVVTQGSFNLKSEHAKESFGDGHAH